MFSWTKSKFYRTQALLSCLSLGGCLHPLKSTVESSKDVIVRVDTLWVVCLLCELWHILPTHPPPPRSVFVVDKVGPHVLPLLVIPGPVVGVPSLNGKHGGCAERLVLHPEHLVPVTTRLQPRVFVASVQIERVGQAAMFMILGSPM